MSVVSGFDDLQRAANASPDSVEEARRRRDVFSTALEGLDDVVCVIPSGSFARRTHRNPIHDVDLLVEFDAAKHPDWGQPGASAEEALEHTREETKRLLGNYGEDGNEVRITGLRNHSVKCFLDRVGAKDGFTVDLTPALRQTGGGLLIPERDSEDWVSSDPERLIETVEKRQSNWDLFRPLVRVLKLWNASHGKTMKSLVVEVLALHYLTDQGGRGPSLQAFFAQATNAVLLPVLDPTGHCGEIQPTLDRNKAQEELAEAADLAWRANSADARGEGDTAQCLWNQVFGEPFPKPACGCTGTGAAVVASIATGFAPRVRRPVRDAPQG